MANIRWRTKKAFRVDYPLSQYLGFPMATIGKPAILPISNPVTKKPVA